MGFSIYGCFFSRVVICSRVLGVLRVCEGNTTVADVQRGEGGGAMSFSVDMPSTQRVQQSRIKTDFVNVINE